MRFCILAVSQILQEKSFDKVLIFDYSRARRRRGFEPSGRKKAAQKPERLVCNFAPFAGAPFLQNGAFRRARTSYGPRGSFLPARTNARKGDACKDGTDGISGSARKDVGG